MHRAGSLPSGLGRVASEWAKVPGAVSKDDALDEIQPPKEQLGMKSSSRWRRRHKLLWRRPRGWIPGSSRRTRQRCRKAALTSGKGGNSGMAEASCGSADGPRARGSGALAAPGAPVDDVTIRGRRQCQADAEQAVDGGPAVADPVPAEGGLVHVALDALPVQPVVHALRPALEVQEDAVAHVRASCSLRS